MNNVVAPTNDQNTEIYFFLYLKTFTFLKHNKYWAKYNLGCFNPFSVNPTKWSNTLKKFVGKSRRIVWVCLTIL